jgi:hypothetical protein
VNQLGHVNRLQVFVVGQARGLRRPLTHDSKILESEPGSVSDQMAPDLQEVRNPLSGRGMPRPNEIEHQRPDGYDMHNPFSART